MEQNQQNLLIDWVNNPRLSTPATNLAIPLDDYSILCCQGQDAKKFLQGQLSCNLDEVSPEQSQIGCYCDHKGRMLVNFWIAQTQQGYFLIFPQNMYALFYKELSKFAAFSKVKLADVSADYHQVGLMNINNFVFEGYTAKYNYNDSLQHLIFPKSVTFEACKTFRQFGYKYWELAMLRQGLICITPETSGLFTPHEVNFAQIGGVSYNKGCYRGQEIIARMHYLGKLKQGLYYCTLESCNKLIPGTEILTAEQQHLGKIVTSTALANNNNEILAVLYNSAVMEAQKIQLVSGSTLTIIKKL